MKILKSSVILLSLLVSLISARATTNHFQQDLEISEQMVLLHILQSYEDLNQVEDNLRTTSLELVPYDKSLVKVVKLACEISCDEISEENFLRINTILDGHFEKRRAMYREWQSRHMYRF